MGVERDVGWSATNLFPLLLLRSLANRADIHPSILLRGVALE